MDSPIRACILAFRNLKTSFRFQTSLTQVSNKCHLRNDKSRTSSTQVPNKCRLKIIGPEQVPCRARTEPVWKVIRPEQDPHRAHLKTYRARTELVWNAIKQESKPFCVHPHTFFHPLGEPQVKNKRRTRQQQANLGEWQVENRITTSEPWNLKNRSQSSFFHRWSSPFCKK